MTRYRKKPVVIEAWQWLNQSYSIWPTWILDWDKDGRVVHCDSAAKTMTIPTLEGDHLASEGDWIIKGVAGEIYPCKPDIFEATYDPAE